MLNSWVQVLVRFLAQWLLMILVNNQRGQIALVRLGSLLHLLIVTRAHLVLLASALAQPLRHGHLLIVAALHRFMLLRSLLALFSLRLVGLLLSIPIRGFLGTLRRNRSKFLKVHLLI
jgi:hypothetical protein